MFKTAALSTCHPLLLSKWGLNDYIDKINLIRGPCFSFQESLNHSLISSLHQIPNCVQKPKLHCAWSTSDTYTHTLRIREKNNISLSQVLSLKAKQGHLPQVCFNHARGPSVARQCSHGNIADPVSTNLPSLTGEQGSTGSHAVVLQPGQWRVFSLPPRPKGCKKFSSPCRPDDSIEYQSQLLWTPNSTHHLRRGGGNVIQ